MKLRIASPVICDSIVDGPGLRMVIWTQGCKHNCKGCHNPQTHSLTKGYEVDTKEVIYKMASLKLQQGITLSGGEPFLQPAPFRGSANQRIIDVKKSLKYRTAVLKFEYMQQQELYTAK